MLIIYLKHRITQNKQKTNFIRIFDQYNKLYKNWKSKKRIPKKHIERKYQNTLFHIKQSQDLKEFPSAEIQRTQVVHNQQKLHTIQLQDIGLDFIEEESKKSNLTLLIDNSSTAELAAERRKLRKAVTISPTLPSKFDNSIPPNNNYEQNKTSCIFKAKDDCRQDALSLQIIELFKHIFKKYELDLHLSPYNVISNRTGESHDLGGIIECIPHTSSRDELGKDFGTDLYQYFIDKFGQETSEGFQSARRNFIKSMVAYSIICYILQIKDRHNGNILIDTGGHIAHIDFGFIFDNSPGHDMRFESADFKLTKEMIKMLGGSEKSEPYNLFVNLSIKAFLAVREYSDVIISTIEPMFYSGFPCFKPWSIELLKKRFRKDLNCTDAAKYMRDLIWDSYDKITTRLYDTIQRLQNNIYH